MYMYWPVAKQPGNQATRHARLPGWGLSRFPLSLGFNQATRHTVVPGGREAAAAAAKRPQRAKRAPAERSEASVHRHITHTKNRNITQTKNKHITQTKLNT